ncbi:MAG: hypothetical protein NT173_07330 [Opitutales bacterium]|nr:hypothetical protein [Opitutales bacterium]
MPPKKQPLFIDLDETLIYAREATAPAEPPLRNSQFAAGHEIVVRPEAPELLRLCRAGGRQVFLFTRAFFGFALTASQTFALGFDERTIFSIAMILNCRRGLCPGAALIDNRPPHTESTQDKMEALGIPPEQVWVIPSFEPPHFPSARLFLLGLPHRLARLDRAAQTRPARNH